MPEDLIIAKIKKTAVSEIWIVLKEYKGKKSCDIREYFHSTEGTEWLPTKKGVSIPLELLPDTINATEKLAEQDYVGSVAELSRGNRAKLCFSIKEFNKHIYAEIRIFFITAEDNDKWHPGKGVTLSLSKLQPLVEALRIAEEHIDNFLKFDKRKNGK